MIDPVRPIAIEDIEQARERMRARCFGRRW